MNAPRPIRAGEERAVQELIAGCYREYGMTLNLADDCERHLLDPGAYFRAHGGDFWVLTEGDDLIATAALHVHDNGTAELKSMYVRAAQRRHGYGRTLTTLVIHAARRAGCSSMELWSDTRFTAAHAMYESLGFARFGERDVADSNRTREFGYCRAL